MIDVEQLLQEIAGDDPAGEDLEYDAAYGELERIAQGKPEQQIGDTVVPAEDPDWRDVVTQATELFSRTKDLRIALYLLRGLTRTEGLTGLRDGLGVLRGLCERYWEGVYPRLDADDDYDPTMRVNIIASLCDADTVLRSVREAPLVSSRAVGRFSLRDVGIASGSIPAPAYEDGQGPPTMTTIDAAFMDQPLEELTATQDAVQQSVELVDALETDLTEKVGAGNATSLKELVTLLKECAAVIAERLLRRGVGGEEALAGEPGAGGEGGESGAVPSAARRTIAGEIGSRDDVLRTLDKICEWYASAEPASPVPLLLQRAKRLVPLGFMDIIRNVAPDAVSEIERLRGPEGEGEGEQSGW